jgi:hypothetical protein
VWSSALALVLLFPVMLDEAAAAARLVELRAGFSHRPKPESMAALDQLARQAEGTSAAARALDWLGDLWRGEHDDGRAAACYRVAYRSADPEAHLLAARGLADLAMKERDYGRAYVLYREARVHAPSEVLRQELELKSALAHKLRWRALAEWAAWAFAVAVIAWLLARSHFWRGPWTGTPTESVYILPLYALIVMACVGRDASVLRALLTTATASLTLVFAAGVSWKRLPPGRSGRWGHSALVAGATLAIFYASCNGAGIIDSLLFTVAP